MHILFLFLLFHCSQDTFADMISTTCCFQLDQMFRKRVMLYTQQTFGSHRRVLLGVSASAVFCSMGGEFSQLSLIICETSISKCGASGAEGSRRCMGTRFERGLPISLAHPSSSLLPPPCFSSFRSATSTFPILFLVLFGSIYKCFPIS